MFCSFVLYVANRASWIDWIRCYFYHVFWDILNFFYPSFEGFYVIKKALIFPTEINFCSNTFFKVFGNSCWVLILRYDVRASLYTRWWKSFPHSSVWWSSWNWRFIFDIYVWQLQWSAVHSKYKFCFWNIELKLTHYGFLMMFTKIMAIYECSLPWCSFIKLFIMEESLLY